MNALTATSSPVAIGATLVHADGRRTVTVIAPPVEGGYLVQAGRLRSFGATDGYFLVQWEYTGLMRFARLTGSTRRQYGQDLPTIDLFAIETTVVNGAIVGTVGKRLPGRFVTWRRNLVTNVTPADAAMTANPGKVTA